MSKSTHARDLQAIGRRIISVSLPVETFASVVTASQDTGESVSGFLARAGAERAARLAKRTAAKRTAAQQGAA